MNCRNYSMSCRAHVHCQPWPTTSFYRQHLPRYMLRHKVRPGITGLAQVNGFRGETETLEKMEQRLAYDLDYLRRWSLWLDVKLICQTVWKTVSDKNAY